MITYCNGVLLSDGQEPSLGVTDPAIRWGQMVFETLRTYDQTRIFAVDEHLDRLFRSAEILGFETECFSKDMEKGLQKSVDFFTQQEEGDLRIRITMTASDFWIEVLPLNAPSEHWYERGVVVVDTVFERMFPEAKYVHPAYKYFRDQQAEGVFETLFFSSEGYLREGNISNVFAVFGDKVLTPKEGILQGVTRDKILMTAQELHFDVQEVQLCREDLEKADEIFLTNTSKEVIPVRRWGTWENHDFEIAHFLREHFPREA